MRRSRACILVSTALATLPVAAQTPLGTVFTYQGKLENAGTPANGLHDLRFQMFTLGAGGAQVGSTICSDAVNLVDGLFTVPLDFGAQFDGNQRFLQVFVRADSTPGNCASGSYTQLNPRQPLTATPYALKVPGIDGFSLDAADGNPVDALVVDNSGNVGIGTAAPAQKLSVAGTVQSTSGGFMFPNGSVQTSAAGASLFAANGSHIFNTNTGNVGIGTTTPSGRLDIQASNNSNVLFGRRTGGGLAHNLFIDGTGNGSMQLLDSTGTARINLGAQNSTFFNYGNVGIGTQSPFFRLTTVANFPSDGVGVIGSSPNAPAFSLGASGHGTSYLGMATDTDNFSSDAAPGDLVLLSPLGKKLLLQSGNSVSALAVVAGNVGIGTTTPAAKLDVNGTTRTKVLEITGADLAEKFPASETLEPGMVVAIDPTNSGKLCLARGAYNACVAGVVSGANNFSVGAVLGNLPGNEDAPAVALSGRVYVWCDAAAGPIAPGNLLTTSETPGHAMKATDRDRSHGAVIGKAMERLDSGRGLVLVLVNLQ